LSFPQHITGIRTLDTGTIDTIFKETKIFREKLDAGQTITEDLSGLTVLNFFLENSTRTRVSFDLAGKMLNMKVVNFSGESSSLSKGESILDTIRNIGAMRFNFIVARHSVPGFPGLLIKNTKARVINGGDGTNEHPTQALLDMFTLKQAFGELKDLRVCIIGNISHSRVARSDIHGLVKYGAKVSICGPASFIPSGIEQMGVTICSRVEDAIKDNDALILLRVQMERNAGALLPSLQEFNKFYGINGHKLMANPGIKILHPGPWNKNVEIDDDVIESENSLIFEQVTNGLCVKLALFKLMTE
jgi:aspartate carbamoyltransferase catalytic subunit